MQEIERLESELADAKAANKLIHTRVNEPLRSPTIAETSATVGIDLSEIEPADLLNGLKGRRKKSKADLGDMAAILELLAGEGDR